MPLSFPDTILLLVQPFCLFGCQNEQNIKNREKNNIFKLKNKKTPPVVSLTHHSKTNGRWNINQCLEEVCKSTPCFKNAGQNTEKKKPSHEPEQNVSVRFDSHTGSTTLWLQLTALCRPVKWWFNDSFPSRCLQRRHLETLNQAGQVKPSLQWLGAETLLLHLYHHSRAVVRWVLEVLS